MSKITQIIVDEKLFHGRDFPPHYTKMSEVSKELLEINTKEEFLMWSWCVCSWWSKWKHGKRTIITAGEKEDGFIYKVSIVCNKCNKLDGHSGFCFPKEKNEFDKLKDIVYLLEDKKQ
jgi:hypothetical protein